MFAAPPPTPYSVQKAEKGAAGTAELEAYVVAVCGCGLVPVTGGNGRMWAQADPADPDGTPAILLGFKGTSTPITVNTSTTAWRFAELDARVCGGGGGGGNGVGGGGGDGGVPHAWMVAPPKMVLTSNWKQNLLVGAHKGRAPARGADATGN